MPIPTSEKNHALRALDRYCRKWSPPHVADQLRVDHRFVRTTAEIVEHRPGWRDPEHWTELVVAKLRYSVEHGDWTLYWPDRNSKFHIYEGLGPSRRINRLLQEIDDDPTHIFWG